MEKLRSVEDLEFLIQKYAGRPRQHDAPRSFVKSFCLALFFVVFLPVATLAGVASSIQGMETVTGLAVAAAYESADTVSDAGTYWYAIRSSPDLTRMKLFFYTLWVIVVLVGTAVVHERTRESIS